MRTKKRWMVVGGGLGALIGWELAQIFVDTGSSSIGWIVFVGVGALLLPLLLWAVLPYVAQWRSWPLMDVVLLFAGLVSGLLVALLLIPVYGIFGEGATALGAILSLGCATIGMRFVWGRRRELSQLWHFAEITRPQTVAGQEPIVLDTSVIIDGRIADLCKTGFLQGRLIVPVFVLEELQHIADSADVLKRNRGRRGLDVLQHIQKEARVAVRIHDERFADIGEVDSKLVSLAKKMKGKVMTNDYNLNKVCEVQGIAVLNLNDLANALKPVVLPGESLSIRIIKEGKEQGQGIAYLDDGTMIVVENGREAVGAHVDVLVTSVLQTSAGRMIFARPRLMEKAL